MWLLGTQTQQALQHHGALRGRRPSRPPPSPRRPNPVPAKAPTSQALLKRVPSSTPSAARWTHLRHTPISALNGTRKPRRREQGLVRRLKGLQQQRLAVAAPRSYTLPTQTNGRATSHHTNDTDSRRRSCRALLFTRSSTWRPRRPLTQESTARAT